MASLRSGGADLAAAVTPKNDIANYITPPLEEVVQWFSAVRGSTHVQMNESYRASAAEVEFKYALDDDTVNAYAARNREGGRKYEICFYVGAMRFSRLASLAVAADLCGRPGTASRFVRSLDSIGRMSRRDAVELMTDCGLDEVFSLPGIKTKAQAVSAGMIIGILAHEMGHVCLGHVMGPNYYDSNQEIGRNHEREADSFASSVTAASPFGEYVFEGTLFWYYALSMQETDKKVATTHPLSRERLENLIRANTSKATALGIRIPN